MEDKILKYRYLLKQLYNILNKLQNLDDTHDNLISSLKEGLLINDNIIFDNELSNMKKDIQEIINKIKKDVITEINNNL